MTRLGLDYMTFRDGALAGTTLYCHIAGSYLVLVYVFRFLIQEEYPPTQLEILRITTKGIESRSVSTDSFG